MMNYEITATPASGTAHTIDWMIESCNVLLTFC